MSIKVNRLTNTIVASDPRCSNNFVKIEKKRNYFRKSNASRTKVKEKALFMFEHFKNKHFAFITITTQQSVRGWCDSTLMAQCGVLLRNKNFFGKYYINVVERQRNTGDLHFHVLTFFDDKNFINFKILRMEIADIFGCVDHPALLQVDFINNYDTGKVAKYMSKLSSYVSKTGGGDTPYSSMFFCRTFSVSNALSAEWKKCADRYVIKVSASFIHNNASNLVVLHNNSFFCIYKNNAYLWQVAQQYRLRETRLTQREEVQKFKKQIKNENCF